MSNISFDMSANDQNVEKTLVQQQKEIAKLTAELEKLRTKTTENTKAAQDAAKTAAEQNKLAAEAQKVITATRTETERHSAAVAKLDELKHKGLLTEEQYSRALEAERSGLQSTKDSQAAAAKATAEHNRELEESRRVIDGLKTPQDRYKERVERLNQLRDKGLLTTEQHAAAIAKEGQGLNTNAKAADTFGSSLSSAATKMGMMVAGFSAATFVLQQMRAEYDALIERQGRSRDKNLDLGKEQEALIENLGGEDAGKLFSQIRGLSKGTGIEEDRLTAAMNETLAARGDMSLDSVFKAVETTSKVKKLDPAKIPVMAAATLDVQKQTGMSAEESLGFLMQLQSQSRVKSLGSLAENVTPGIGAVMEFGADRQTAAGMMAALSHGMGDTTGAQTKTSAIQLARQLEAFGGKGSDLGQLMKDIQADPQLQEIFLANASFEAAALPAVRSLLGGGKQAQQFAGARSVFAQDPTGALNAAIAARGASPAIGLAEGKAQLDNFISQQQLADMAGAESAIVRESMQKIRDGLGRSRLSQSALQIFDDAASGGYQSFEDAIAALESEREAARIGQSDLTNALGFVPGASSTKTFLQSRNAVQNVRQIEQLDQLIAALQEQNKRLAAQQNAGAMAGKATAQRER
ncbi:MAG: hypothetical protein JNL58_04520 [Planctomyces sp.]|nr:hypothetical protein [Planctomyces sp.]